MYDDENGTPLRQRIGRVMFVIAAVLIAIPLCIAAFNACENIRITGDPLINIEIG